MFCGFGDDGIACCQCRADLTEKDCQGEIPWTDTQDNAARPQAAFRKARLDRACGVIAQEVHRLANLCHGIPQRLAGLFAAQCDELVTVCFQRIRQTEQTACSLLNRQR